MIVHTFPSHHDDWILPYHLAAYSRFVDRIVVVLDRSPQSEAICRSFAKVEVHHFDQSPPGRLNDPNGVVWHDGKLRQMCWDLAAAHRPDWIFLGDADEVPTPDVAGFAACMDPAVDAYYVDWVNLWGDAQHVLGGVDCRWSYRHPQQRKRPLAARWREGVDYRYRLDVTAHGDIEPNRPAVFDASRPYVTTPKMIHYKYASRAWQTDALRLAGGQYSNMEQGAEIESVPAEWHWPDLPREVLA